jgi:hypothetical protein
MPVKACNDCVTPILLCKNEPQIFDRSNKKKRNIFPHIIQTFGTLHKCLQLCLLQVWQCIKTGSMHVKITSISSGNAQAYIAEKPDTPLHASRPRMAARVARIFL